MTREEAINLLDLQLHGTPEQIEQHGSYEHATAIRMAITALKAEPCGVTWVTNNKGEGVAFKDMPIEKVNKILAIMDDEPCEDAVSRQAVLDLIADYDLSMGQVVKSIHALPPVTPKQRTGKWIYEKRERLVNETDEGAVYVTDYWCKCSKCGGDFGYRKMKDAFCKYCGAKMEGESK